MLNTENINYIELNLLEGQVDLILDALQLYAFNFHRVWPVDYDSAKEDLRNALLFHTYEQIQCKYNSSRYTHREYNVINSCRAIHRRKRVQNFYNSKKVA